MKTQLDMDKIAKGLGAERRGKVAASGGYFGAMQPWRTSRPLSRTLRRRATDGPALDRAAARAAGTEDARTARGDRGQGPGARGSEPRADAARGPATREDGRGNSARKRPRNSCGPSGAPADDRPFSARRFASEEPCVRSKVRLHEHGAPPIKPSRGFNPPGPGRTTAVGAGMGGGSDGRPLPGCRGRGRGCLAGSEKGRAGCGRRSDGGRGHTALPGNGRRSESYDRWGFGSGGGPVARGQAASGCRRGPGLEGVVAVSAFAVVEDAVDDDGIGDHRDDAQLDATLRAEERVDFQDPAQEAGPTPSPGPGEVVAVIVG